MWNTVKRFREIKQDEINIFSIINTLGEVLNGQNGTSLAKAMLGVGKNIVLAKMIRNATTDDVFCRSLEVTDVREISRWFSGLFLCPPFFSVLSFFFFKEQHLQSSNRSVWCLV